MGNRGCLHDAHRRLRSGRPWKTEAWIACRLQFKGRKRALMQPGAYTELFFLDEATALAAGYRPCAECRRADYNRFREAFQIGQGWTSPPSAKVMDATLHSERTGGVRQRALAAELPDGAMVALGGGAWLKRGHHLLAWDFEGYGARREPPREPLEVLTPPSTLTALRAGYVCGLHPTAA